MHLFSKENIWSNPHASSIHPVIQTSTIILWTELFPKKRREKIQGEILQSIFKYSGVSTNNTRTTRFLRIQCILQELQCFHTQSSNSKFPQLILCTELILPQEILQLQGSPRVIPCRLIQGIFQRLLPCIQASQAAASIASTQPLQLVPGHFQDKSSQDSPKTTCARTIQGYKFPRAFSQDNSFQEYRTGQSPKTIRPRTTPGRTFQDNSSQDISTRYMVFQDNWSQDRNHYTTCPKTHQ